MLYSRHVRFTQKEQINNHKVVAERSLLQKKRGSNRGQVPCKWVLFETSESTQKEELEIHPNSEMPLAGLQPAVALAPRRGGCSCRLLKLFLWRPVRCRARRAVHQHKLPCDGKVSGVQCIHEGCRECVDGVAANPFREKRSLIKRQRALPQEPARLNERTTEDDGEKVVLTKSARGVRADRE